ncbi:hypothetical protein KC19_10G138900 [Ceratodon purpureus]|uniref:Cupin type-2 domain-containing protein n=1 Tax=Ceratodon purpureus TaxID=3225 RepID=A0A8T0GN27_CERPU|nr:hypothetical protein KC19_10G138900 [Ceratodon purpureus]
MDQVSFCASQFSGITNPKLGMLAPGQGTSVWALGLLITIKALGSENGGSYSLSEMVVYPGQEVSRHLHTSEDEMWYMLEGELIWNLGGRESLGRKGSFIHLPRFIPHSFMNKSDKPARMMLMYTPGGFEQWYLDVGKKVHDISDLPPEVTADELSQALQRGQEYGIMFVDHDLEELSHGKLSKGAHYR